MGEGKSWLSAADGRNCGVHQRTYVVTVLKCYIDMRTQVGKSSFTNSLIRRAACPIYKLSFAQEGPTTTALAQETTLEIDGKAVRLVDTPGLSWLPLPDQSAENVQAQRPRDILTRNKGRIDRLKDPEPVGKSSIS